MRGNCPTKEEKEELRKDFLEVVSISDPKSVTREFKDIGAKYRTVTLISLFTGESYKMHLRDKKYNSDLDIKRGEIYTKLEFIPYKERNIDNYALDVTQITFEKNRIRSLTERFSRAVKIDNKWYTENHNQRLFLSISSKIITKYEGLCITKTMRGLIIEEFSLDNNNFIERFCEDPKKLFVCSIEKS